MDVVDNQKSETISDEMSEETRGAGGNTTLEQTKALTEADGDVESNEVLDKNGNDLNGDSGHSSLDGSPLKTSSMSDKSEPAPEINGESIEDEKALRHDFDQDSVDSLVTGEIQRNAEPDTELPVMTPIEDVIGMRESQFSSENVGSPMPVLIPLSDGFKDPSESDAEDSMRLEEAVDATKSVQEEKAEENANDLDSSFDDEDDSRLVIDEPNKSIDESEAVANEGDDLMDKSVSINEYDLMEDEESSDDEGLLDDVDEDLLEVEESESEEQSSESDDEDDQLEDDASEKSQPKQLEAHMEVVKSAESTEKPCGEATTSTADDVNPLLCNEEFRSPEKASSSAPPRDNGILFDRLITELAPSDPNPPPAKAPVPRKEGPKRSFVDSLLSKIREGSDSSESESPSKLQKLLSESEDDLLVEVDTPVRFNEPKNPNLLATPIIRNQRSVSSAFVSNAEEYDQMVAKHKVTRKPSHLEDRNQMGSKSEPPRMQAPHELSNAQRPRTLAEKRQLIQGNNMRVLTLEQESKIYRQVQRKKANMEINYQLLDSMIHDNVPISHEIFRVLTWLRTREGKFIQSFVNVNGTNYKLNGSRGNHRSKYLPDLSTRPFPSRRTLPWTDNCCKGAKIKRRILKAVTRSESMKKFLLKTTDHANGSDVHLQMDTKLLDNRLSSIGPRPLSKKVGFLNTIRKNFKHDEDAAFLGDYSTFQMPNICLEVKVQPKTALDPCAKRYLKEILPHRDLTENWCEFALSALELKEDDEKGKDVFEFSVPYQGKRSILVRDILRSKEDNEQLRIQPYTAEDEDEDDMEWTFCKGVDEKDEIELEVVEVIKDLTNSVFLNLNDDLFTQEDPHDRVLASTISPVKAREAIDELSKQLPKPNHAKRTLMELKRLNANVFKSDSACIDDENDMRRHATAHLAKDEREMRTTVIVTDSDTILLGNQQKESRRIKRAPKRFEDYTGQDSQDEPAAKKSRDRDDSTYNPMRGPSFTYVEDKFVKKEVLEMIHCTVDIPKLDCLEDIAPWCMVHRLYKCHCKGTMFNEELRPPTVVKTQEPLRPGQSRRIFTLPPRTGAVGMKQLPQLSRPQSPDRFNRLARNVEGTSKRTSPVTITTRKRKNVERSASAVISSKDGDPKLEIVNLGDLINGRKGPIYISIHDNPTMRLNNILRSVLNNASAIVSFDSKAYFIDKKRIDIKKMDFSGIIDDLDNPIFIIQAKETEPSDSEKKDKVVFNKESMSVVSITDTSALNDISDIIESILRNVRKKIKTQLGENPTEHVKQQLEMITSRSRSVSRSNESVLSTHSSPLSFEGRKLVEAPPPGIDSALLKQFNDIFSMRMKTLVALVRSNTLGLCPSRELLNKFYIYQWGLLLKSFEEDMIQVWQVTLEGEQGGKYQHLVMTDTLDVPDVENAARENIVNIRSLSLSSPINEVARLILLRIETARMKNLTVLLYGCRGYFRICGLLNSNEPYYKNGFVAKPNRTTHPRVTEKIQKIYHIWHATKMAQPKKKTRKVPMNRRVRDEPYQSMPKAKQKSAPEPRPDSPVQPLTDPLSGPIEENSPPTAVVLSSNPLGSIAKKPGQSDYKWFLFNVTNDFSDVYVKNWNRYLSFSFIMQAISRAKRQRRAVALVPKAENLKNWPRIYALPAAPLKFKEQDSMTKDFLIFGPYMRNTMNSNLLLMQNVDGEMMMREEYEKKNSIVREKRTRCLWIYANTLKSIQDVDSKPVMIQLNKAREKNASHREPFEEDDNSSSSVEAISSNGSVPV